MADAPIKPWAGRARADALHYIRTKGASGNLPCSLCHQPIDYRLRYPHPQSCSVQHVKSRVLFPHLTWVRANWAPAHLDCNKSAGDGTNAATNAALGVITPLWASDGQPIAG